MIGILLKLGGLGVIEIVIANATKLYGYSHFTFLCS